MIWFYFSISRVGNADVSEGIYKDAPDTPTPENLIPGDSISPKWYYDQNFLDYVDKKWKSKDKYSPKVKDASVTPNIVPPVTENWTDVTTPVPAALIHPKWYYDNDFLDYVDKKWKKKIKENSVRTWPIPKAIGPQNARLHDHTATEFKGLGRFLHLTLASFVPMESYLPRWW